MPTDDDDAVELEDEHDRWRYRCPNGHTNWEPTNHHFWCASCARHCGPSVDGRFEALHDKVRGRDLPREDVTLQCEAGPYDPDLDRPEGSA